MSNIWFPVPVSLFLRRVVNVLSTLSITHHYLFPLPPRPTGADTDKNAGGHPFSSSPWTVRFLDGPRQQEAERHVLPWARIMENSFLNHIRQGTKFLPKLPFDLGLSLTFFCDYMHSIGEALCPLVSLARTTLALPPCIRDQV